MIEVRSQDINELELLVVLDQLEKAGTKSAQIYKGNGCIWVTSGVVNQYYIFRDGIHIDTQVD